MSKAVDIIDGVLFVHTRHYDDVNRVIICHQKKPLRVFSDDAEKELGRPHGEWLISSDRTRACCPFCHNKWTDAKEIALLDTAFRAKNFCEYCGADMRKEGDRK